MPEGLTARPRRRTVGMAAGLAVVLALGSCSSVGDDAADGTVSSAVPTTAAETSAPADRLCDASGAVEGRVVSDELDETSGLVASRSLPDVLWAHDDSGGDAALFAVGLDGSDRGRVEIAGVDPVDWEDAALLPGADGGPNRILIADIGDNLGVTRDGEPIALLRLDEPAAADGTAEAATIRLTYPDGPRDAEALLADPLTGDAFVVSKQWDGAEAGLYRVAAEELATTSPDPSVVVVMPRLASVAGTTAALVTGGDISPDGRVVVLRTYADVRIWDRAEGASVAEALSAPPRCSIAVDEPQGEAAAVLADGSGFVTVSEGENPDVIVFSAP